MGQSKQKIRQKLYQKQKGLCYYCKCKTILIKNKKRDFKTPPNMATIEHLDNKLKKNRDTSKIVLACYNCNQKKGVEDVKKHVRQLCCSTIRQELPGIFIQEIEKDYFYIEYGRVEIYYENTEIKKYTLPYHICKIRTLLLEQIHNDLGINNNGKTFEK